MSRIRVNILGVDLAWGERNSDGLCWLEVGGEGAGVREVGLSHGDDALVAWVQARAGSGPAWVLVDAPLICPNATGRRPVDGEVSQRFRVQHAGCHPANSTKCARPVRVGRRLAELGFEFGWRWSARARRLIEVYPHPAIVRWFGLDRIVKYKRGPVAERRREFGRLQRLIAGGWRARFPELQGTPAVRALLRARWTKAIEDQLDACLCALIGYQHHLTRGRGSEVFGDVEHGFILVPGVAPFTSSDGALRIQA